MTSDTPPPNSPTGATPDHSGQTIVAVDLGNTAVKLMLRGEPRGDRDSAVFTSIRLDSGDWAKRVVQWVSECSSVANMDEDVDQWRIASVNRHAEGLLRTTITSAGENRVRRLDHRDVPMPVRVDAPEKVGIDRLLGAYAASRQGTPAVVVDAGSAVTVDLVDDEGGFRGGAILPGLELQSRSLATGTDMLPQIDWTDERQPPCPATQTIDAIRLGVMTNVAAAIDRLVRCYADTVSGRPTIVLTGGDALALQPHLADDAVIRRHLVCEAILLID